MSGVSLGAAKVRSRASFPGAITVRSSISARRRARCRCRSRSRNKHLTGGGFDLPVRWVRFSRIRRVARVAGSAALLSPATSFSDACPKADVLVMGHILHDWGARDETLLVTMPTRRCPRAALISVYDAVIDDDRRRECVRLADELEYADRNAGGFRLHRRRLQRLDESAGFRETRVEPLVGPDSMVIGIK